MTKRKGYKFSDEVIEKVANYIIENESTLRAAAKHFGLSKSTVHKFVSEYLQDISYNKYTLIQKILKWHLIERHLNGGIVTKKKYDAEFRIKLPDSGSFNE